MPRESYTLQIEDVFMITGRGVAVSGVHSGGDVHTGDAATVLDDAGLLDVPRLTVEMHAPPGKLCLVLHGVGFDAVRSGSVLEGHVHSCRSVHVVPYADHPCVHGDDRAFSATRDVGCLAPLVAAARRCG
jgi:hypothetical protein